MVICNVFWGIVIGIVAVVVAFFLIMFLLGLYKSLKDPDVKAATSLGMTIRNYKKYKKIWEEQQGNEAAGHEAMIDDQQEWERFKAYQASNKQESSHDSYR